MEITVTSDQLILSGPVITGDYDAVESRLSSQPQIKMIILRNSPGGDAPTGYKLGELFRQKSMGTAVSGYCYSSCSRLFLGGKERYFTDDYPPNYTQIGLHGHYDGKGDLNAASVNELHLKDWIIRFSDGKADQALVERWINIPRGTGLIHFYNPASVNMGGYSTFMCQGTEPSHPRIFDCERISKNALDLGIVTSLTLVHSRDQQQIRATILENSATFRFRGDIGRYETSWYQRTRPARISAVLGSALTEGVRHRAFRPRLGLEFFSGARRRFASACKVRRESRGAVPTLCCR